jgi:cyclopropane-fatty-acyl-phospholipid synthase
VPSGNTTDDGRQRLSGGTLPDSIGETQTTPHPQSKWLSSSASRIVGSDADEVRSHYDISNEFFRLWQDPTQTYSCAYFERDDMTLQEAQIAKIDLALGKLGLQPGMTLLDIGCGWGSTMMRALERYDVNVIGLTLSHNQKEHIEQLLAQSNSQRSKEVRLQPWEEWEGRVDRIVSIGAFEHFGFGKYDDYFKRTFNALPDDGKMLLHSIVIPSDEEIRERKLPLTMSRVRFIKFILDEIYPGGRLPLVAQVEGHATKAGFSVTRVQPLRPHYARTLDTWAANLESKRDDAIAITSEEVYERFMKYLTGCADLFRNGYTDVCQFTCEKA